MVAFMLHQPVIGGPAAGWFNRLVLPLTLSEDVDCCHVLTTKLTSPLMSCSLARLYIELLVGFTCGI